MTHIQSIFDLCSDIQERIGKELAPRMKSKKLKMKSIHQCKDLMNEYDILKLEDYVFASSTQNHIGRILLFIINKKNNSDDAFCRSMKEWVYSKNSLLMSVPNLSLRRLDILYYLMYYQPSPLYKGDEINIYGLKWKTYLENGKYVSRYYYNFYRKPVVKYYTSNQLDEIAEPLGIKKWQKHWKKEQKIQCLIVTEV
jgi:hypothetical protein